MTCTAGCRPIIDPSEFGARSEIVHRTRGNPLTFAGGGRPRVDHGGRRDPFQPAAAISARRVAIVVSGSRQNAVIRSAASGVRRSIGPM